MFQITGKEISGHNQKSPSPVKKQPNKKHTEFAHSFQKEHKTKHTHFTMTPRAKGLSGPQQIIYISTSVLSRLKGGARVFALFCPPLRRTGLAAGCVGVARSVWVWGHFGDLVLGFLVWGAKAIFIGKTYKPTKGFHASILCS